MQTSRLLGLLKNSFLLVWVILCVMVSMLFSDSISFIHQFSFNGPQDFPSKLARIEPLYYLGNLLGALIGVLLFSMACVALGAFFLIILKMPKADIRNTTDRLITVGTAFLIGQGILSILSLTLIGIYELTQGAVITILVASYLIGAFSLKELFRINLGRFITFSRSMGKMYRFIIYLSAIILFFCLLYSSSRLSYDAVNSYFSNAKITALTNHILFFPDEAYTASAFHIGINYIAIIEVFGDQAARMYSWINGIVILLFSFALGGKLGLSRQAKILTVVLIITSTAFLDLMGDGKIDLACTAPIVSAIYWMVTDSDTRSKNVLLLIGFLAGFGMISRPYNIFLETVFIGLFYLVQMYQQKINSRLDYVLFVRTILWLSPGIVCLFAFDLATNWMIAGNPLAPLLAILNYKVSTWQWSYDPNLIWVIRLLYPFAVTFMNTPQSLGNISPLFIAFLPSLLSTKIRKNIQISRLLKELIIVTTVTLLLWIVLFFTVSEIRYVFFLWIIFFIVSAQIIEASLEHQEPVIRWSLALTSIVLLIFMALRTVYISLDTYSPLDYEGNPQCYDSPWCKFLEPVNKVAAKGDRVLTLNAYRYYLRTDLFACSSKGMEYSRLEGLSNQNDIAFWEEVYRQGYKFVTYEEEYTQRHLRLGLIPNPGNTPSWLHLEPIYGLPGDAEVAYEIQVKDPPFESQTDCRKTDARIWEVQSLASPTK